MTKDRIISTLRDFITDHEGEERGEEFVFGETCVGFQTGKYSDTLVIGSRGIFTPTTFIEIPHIREVRINNNSVFFSTHLSGTFATISSPARS